MHESLALASIFSMLFVTVLCFIKVKVANLGGIGLNQFNREHNFCDLGFWVRESRQRQGIASRAARAVTAFGFRELTLTRIEIVIAEGNILSRRVAEKLGATFECVARNRLVSTGVPLAAAVYSLIPDGVQARSMPAT
jgi:ribosomal-protein-serine acetyltransferase